MNFINLTRENLEGEHICCAISDKKHQEGVDKKKEWIRDRIGEGHVFRRLDERGKVFIEYSNLERAWTPIIGENYLYIHCLWVSGKFKKQGYASSLLQYCIEDAKEKKKSGICIISSKKKKPFLSDKRFMVKYGFEVVDISGDYELLALSFDGSYPSFAEIARQGKIESDELTIYYGLQCPYIPNCIREVADYCKENGISLNLIAVDTLEKAKRVPGIFNNWAVFYKGKFQTVHLLNVNYLEKLLK